MKAEKKKIRLGVIGIGNMGSEHCLNILAGKCPEIGITAVADRKEERRKWAADRMPGVEIFEEGSDLIRGGSCDAVLISVPHYGHEPLTVEALNRGLDVLCEKPASVTSAGAARMEEAAKRTGRTLAFMFNQRTNSVYRAMHDVLASGSFGAIKRVSWIITDWYRTQEYYDSGNWRATWAGEGGGVLLNQCPHQLDLLIWLCGMPKKVRAVCHEGKWHRIEVEDDVSAYFEFENGATGTFVASTGDLPGTNRLEIDCEMGKIVCEDGIVRCWKLEENERIICFSSDNPWFRTDTSVTVLKTDGQNPQHIGVLNTFAAHLLRGEPLIAGPEDGVRAILLSNAIHLAGWTGETVSIPIDEERFERLLQERVAHSRKKAGNERFYETSHMGTGEKIAR